MKRKLIGFALLAVTAALAGGCVSSGTYQAKEQETQQLSKNLDETRGSYSQLKDKYDKLEAVSNEQSEKLKKISAELAELKVENAKLVDATQPESLLKTLAETFTVQQQKIRELKAENAKMKQELLAPQKLQPVAPPPGKAPVEGEVKPLTPAAL